MCVIFVASDDSTEILQPRVQSFHFPSLPIPPQWSSVLSPRAHPVGLMRRDHFNATLFQPLVQGIGVIGPITHDASRSRFGKSLGKRFCHQGDFMRSNRIQVHGDWKT